MKRIKQKLNRKEARVRQGTKAAKQSKITGSNSFPSEQSTIDSKTHTALTHDAIDHDDEIVSEITPP